VVQVFKGFGLIVNLTILGVIIVVGGNECALQKEVSSKRLHIFTIALRIWNHYNGGFYRTFFCEISGFLSLFINYKVNGPSHDGWSLGQKINLNDW
ncbi:hypothetical protein H5410_005034, partial [Solanum commersonii]